LSGDDLLMVAGEASGDLHAARLLAELHELRPELRVYGVGGDEMSAAGAELLAHSQEIAVVGLTEALKVLGRAREIFAQVLDEVERRGTRWAVLVDFAEFNLRLAKKLHRRGVRVIYYISPQVWAWRRGRVKTIARCVERMLVLFPFEVDFYRRHGVEVSHVGHPLIDEVPELEQRWQGSGVPAGDEPFVVALLPGSRASEVGALLPVMLRSAARLGRELPVVVRLIQAPTVPDELFEPAIEASGLGAAGVPVERVRQDRFHAVADSHLALCASGTATVEVGLLTTPLVVLYRLTLLSYLLGRVLVKLPFFSMVNLVLERPAVPELMQRDAEPERVAAAAARLLRDPEAIAEMRRALGELRERLGEGGASRRAAAEVARLLAEGER